MVGAVCLLLSSTVYAEDLKSTDANIVGHVIEKSTREHLPYMTVSLKGTTIGTMTDATGHYFLKNLPEGEFTLSVSAVGYKSQERKVVLKRGKTLEENFELEEDMVALDGVVVTANRNETARRLAPTLVKVVTPKLFEQTNSHTLSQGLAFQPGVRVETDCQNCGYSQVRVIIQMTWPGAPTIYYGDEAGVCGWTDPDNRRTYPWGSEDQELIAFHKAAIAMHKSQEVLKTGSYKPLVGEYNLIAYGRFNQKDAVVVIVNNSEDERRVRVPVWELGITDKDEMEQIFVTFDGGFGEEQLWYTVNGGWLDIGLRKTSAVVLKRVKW